MKGRVYAIDSRLAFARLDDGGICWFEPLSGDVEVGEVISGELCSHGRQQLRNETRGRTVGVLIEGHTEPASTPKRKYFKRARGTDGVPAGRD